ncbi:MAG: PaaI family thioesterase [Oscillibacter sp.]|jgi:acyl-CoA thioesterase|nr:PaaI family thioesterase [Oscillibacter sp.]
MDYEQIRAFRNEKNLFGRQLGIYVEELRPGYARAVKTVEEEDLNPLRVPHGGVYFSLADTACGSAMAAYGTMAVTVSCSFSFLKSARAGELLTAEARELPGGRSICVLEARVTGAEGELLAVGTFTFRRLHKAIGP